MSKHSLTSPRQQLTYAAAAIAVQAAVAKSREIEAPECIAVVDAGGNLLAFARVDGAAPLARDPAIAKAATSASLGAPTGAIPFEFGASRQCEPWWHRQSRWRLSHRPAGRGDRSDWRRIGQH
jgi:glc operon protein GlcG